MAPKVRSAAPVSVVLLLAAVLACCLASYVGFLAGAHHSGALTAGANHHPALLQPCVPAGAAASAGAVQLPPNQTRASDAPAILAAFGERCPKDPESLSGALEEEVDALEEEVGRLKGELAAKAADAASLNDEVVRLNALVLSSAAVGSAPEGKPLDCPKCAEHAACPKCPAAATGGKHAAAAAPPAAHAHGGPLDHHGDGRSGQVIKEGGWGGLHRVDAMALHDLLMPNFPPRKDNNAKGALLLTHGGPRPEFTTVESLGHELGVDEAAFEGGVRVLQSSGAERAEAAASLSSCDEVSVVLTKGDGRTCLALFEVFDAPPYHVFRLRRKATAAMKAAKAPTAWAHASRYENKEGHMPPVPLDMDGPTMRKMGAGDHEAGGRHTNASALLLHFLNERPRIDGTLQPLLWRLAANAAAPGDKPLPYPVAAAITAGSGRALLTNHGGGHKGATWPPAVLGPVLVLAVNGGVLDLVLNFLCSARRQKIGGTGMGGDVLQSMLVFAADDEVERAMSAVGVATFRHQALGSFPSNSAGGYGDDIFTSMMWLKVVSVYSCLRLGVDVLFQDADVVWWRDPRPFFQLNPSQQSTGAGGLNGGAFDAYFQNDGARSQRYSPFSANTGFYFLRSTAKARYLMHDLLHSYNLISTWKSHQHVLCQLLVEHYSKTGLSVHILPHRLFSIGQQYHRKKDFMSSLLSATSDPRPYVFHWSWTAGKHEKLKYSVETGMWYLKQPSCSEQGIRSHLSDKAFLDGCCIAIDDTSTAFDHAAAPLRHIDVPAPHPYLLLTQPLPAWTAPGWKAPK